MSDLTGQFEFTKETVGHLLADRRLAVPIYQRSFSWSEEEISEFWTDIQDSFLAGGEYFLGTIVLSKEGSTEADTVIDGQQRLATTAICCAAIRDEFERRGDARRAKIVQDDYLSAPHLESGEDVPRLRLNSEDNPFFERLVVSADGEDPAPASSSHGLILAGLDQLRRLVRESAEAAGDEWEGRLLAWVEFLTERLRVIVVEVPTEADAFLIFETLNDRGADLTIADLLKNYLFGRAGDDLDTVRDGWMAALGALEMSAEDSLFTTFVRHFWSSKYGATRERLLYKSIKERVTTRVHAVDFSQELRGSARHYAAILNSEHESWADLGASSKENVESLARLDLEQIRPLLLAAMQHFSKKELKVTLRALVSWAVRGLVVGGIGGGKTERYYCQAAVSIRSGTTKTAEELQKELAEIVPTDDEFENAFAKARVTSARLARYYLIALERAEKGDPEPELVPNQNEEVVNLEHILPKNADAGDWPQFDEEQRKVWVHRIGNMALLQKEPNGRIGNKAWSVKRPILGQSKLELTKRVVEFSDWTSEEIEARQQELAKLASLAWPLI